MLAVIGLDEQVLVRALQAHQAAAGIEVGGWAPPLGVALRADGLSVVMMLAVAVVLAAGAWRIRGGYVEPFRAFDGEGRGVMDHLIGADGTDFDRLYIPGAGTRNRPYVDAELLQGLARAGQHHHPRTGRYGDAAADHGHGQCQNRK